MKSNIGNITSLLQREHHGILAGMRVRYGESGLRRTNYVRPISSVKLYTSTLRGFPATARLSGTKYFLKILHTMKAHFIDGIIQ